MNLFVHLTFFTKKTIEVEPEFEVPDYITDFIREVINKDPKRGSEVEYLGEIIERDFSANLFNEEMVLEMFKMFWGEFGKVKITPNIANFGVIYSKNEDFKFAVTVFDSPLVIVEARRCILSGEKVNYTYFDTFKRKPKHSVKKVVDISKKLERIVRCHICNMKISSFEEHTQTKEHMEKYKQLREPFLKAEGILNKRIKNIRKALPKVKKMKKEKKAQLSTAVEATSGKYQSLGETSNYPSS